MTYPDPRLHHTHCSLWWFAQICVSLALECYLEFERGPMRHENSEQGRLHHSLRPAQIVQSWNPRHVDIYVLLCFHRSSFTGYFFCIATRCYFQHSGCVTCVHSCQDEDLAVRHEPCIVQGEVCGRLFLSLPVETGRTGKQDFRGEEKVTTLRHSLRVILHFETSEVTCILQVKAALATSPATCEDNAKQVTIYMHRKLVHLFIFGTFAVFIMTLMSQKIGLD